MTVRGDTSDVALGSTADSVDAHAGTVQRYRLGIRPWSLHHPDEWVRSRHAGSAGR